MVDIGDIAPPFCLPSGGEQESGPKLRAYAVTIFRSESFDHRTYCAVLNVLGLYIILFFPKT